MSLNYYLVHSCKSRFLLLLVRCSSFWTFVGLQLNIFLLQTHLMIKKETQTLTFEKLEPQIAWHVCIKNDLNDYQNSCQLILSNYIIVYAIGYSFIRKHHIYLTVLYAKMSVFTERKEGMRAFCVTVVSSLLPGLCLSLAHLKSASTHWWWLCALAKLREGSVCLESTICLCKYYSTCD